MDNHLNHFAEHIYVPYEEKAVSDKKTTFMGKTVCI